MYLQALQTKGLLVVLISAPMLLGGCAESYRWEEENLNQVLSTADQTASAAKTVSGKVDAINEKVDHLYDKSLRK